MLLRHGRYDNDGDETTDGDKEHAHSLGVGDDAVGENNHGGCEPKDQQVSDVGVPWLVDVCVLMVYGVHGHGDVRRDLDEGRKVKLQSQRRSSRCFVLLSQLGEEQHTIHP